MDPSGQAAWVQGIVSIMAIGVAIYVPYWQKRLERSDKQESDLKIVMSAAAKLDVALQYQAIIFSFTPAGDGAIGHQMTTVEEARNFMKLQPQTREALKDALDKAHYFSKELCEEIVRLSIEASAYERIIDEQAMLTPAASADAFFALMTRSNSAIGIGKRLTRVHELLRGYLPA